MGSNGNARKIRLEHLPFRNLQIDERTQRQFIPARVRYFVKNWNLGKVGTLQVSQRDNGFFIINGQHRWRAAIELGLGDTKVRCDVYQNVTVADEAALFLSEGDVRPVSPIDKFRIGLTANDPEIVGVAAILSEFDLQVGKNGYGIVACPDRLLRLYRQSPDVLRATLAAVVEAWGTRPAALEALLLGGMGFLLARANGDIDRRVLVKKLQKYRGGPAALVGDARGLADIRPITAQQAVAEIIRDTYNKGKRSGELGPL